MHRRLLLPGLLLAALLFAAPARAAFITFETIVQSPNELRLNVGIVGVEDLVEAGSDLFAFEFDISFDPLAFDADFQLEILEGDFLSRLGLTAPPIFVGDLASGLLTVFSTLLMPVPGATEDGLLATLIFTGGRPGDPTPQISNANLARFRESTSEFELVSVPLSSVPEPSTLGVMGIGLIVLARGLRRKSKQL